jgi:hypothetical protein
MKKAEWNGDPASAPLSGQRGRWVERTPDALAERVASHLDLEAILDAAR